MTDPDAAADFMVERMNEWGYLPQRAIAIALWRQFGDDVLIPGTRKIQTDVLRQFHCKTKETVVWNPRGLFWRKRKDGDERGRLAKSLERPEDIFAAMPSKAEGYEEVVEALLREWERNPPRNEWTAADFGWLTAEVTSDPEAGPCAHPDPCQRPRP